MVRIEMNIGGQLRGLNFSQGTNILVQDLIKDYSEQDIKAFGAYCIVYAALKADHIAKAKPVDFTFEDVFGWCEALELDDYNKITDAYYESTGFKRPEVVDQGEKKSEELTEVIVTEMPAG